MIDMFGRRVNEGDIIVHVGRQSSSTHLQIARVIATTEKSVRIRVLGGNFGHWAMGVWKYDAATGTGEYDTYDGHESVIRTSNLIMVANGIDASGIHEHLMTTQRENIQKSRDWQKERAQKEGTGTW